MFSFDWTVSVGNVVGVVMWISTVIWMFAAMKADLKIVRNDIKYLQDAFSRLSAILTQVAVQDERITMIMKDVDDLRHGHGFVKRT